MVVEEAGTGVSFRLVGGKSMFKSTFLNLIDISSLEINMALVMQNKKYPKLNRITVEMYHGLFKLKKGKKNAKGNR